MRPQEFENAAADSRVSPRAQRQCGIRRPARSHRPASSERNPPSRPAKHLPRRRQSRPQFPREDRAAALQLIRDDIGDCTRCALHKGRHKIVFADGSPTARLMFVGEGPGADEDAQGLPFVGRAGQLLNNMIAAMGLKREECLHRQRGQVPSAGQPHAGAGRGQHLLAVSLPANRRGAAAGAGGAGRNGGHLSAGRSGSRWPGCAAACTPFAA